MKQFSKQMKKHAESVRLSATEKRELRDRLTAYLEYHPLPQKQVQKKAQEYIQSEPFTLFSFARFNTIYLRGALGTLALMCIVSVPFVAERAMPGDVLYPVKVSFNEPLMGSLAGTEYEKIEWETERLSRRIAEARFLAAEGRLTEDVEAEVAAAVRTHSDAAKQEIATLRKTDAEEAAIAELTLSSALDVQSAVLEADEQKASTSADNRIDGIAAAVQEAKESVDIDTPASTTTPSFAKLSARVEMETTRSAELFSSIEEYAAQPEIDDIERRLKDIERKFTRARELKTDDDTTARKLLREALASTQKLNVFMTNIDVRETVKIEDLIPDELSEEEQIAVIDGLIDKSQELQKTIEAATATIDDPSVRDKVVTGLDGVVVRLEETADAQAAGKLDTAERLASEALSYAEDTVAIITRFTTPDAERLDEDETETDEGVDESGGVDTAEDNAAETASTTDPIDIDYASTSTEQTRAPGTSAVAGASTTVSGTATATSAAATSSETDSN